MSKQKSRGLAFFSALPVLESRELESAPAGSEVDLLAVFQDAGRKLVAPAGDYSDTVQKFRKGDSFTGRAAQVQFLRFGGTNGSENCLLVGLGVPGDLTEEKARQAGGSAWARLSAEKARGAVVHVDSFLEARGLKSELTPLRLLRAFAEGMILPAYQINRYKSGDSSDAYRGAERLTFISTDKKLVKELEAELDRVRAVGEAVTVCRDWSNEPSNIGVPEFFAQEAKKLADRYGLKCRVLTEKDAEREKMGLFLGVGQGAEREGCIVILEYRPEGGLKGKGKTKGKGQGPAGKKTIALVGKGVTFDSGGISIKPSLRMEDMKHDMTGAATVMGAMILAAQWQVPNKVLGVMAFTENMPDGNAIQPGNVLISRAGKSVEVINTDAEGRLILADVLDYVQDAKPDVIIDVATLTGAVSIALGKQACAILGNEESLIEEIRRAGELNGERIWPLPLYDEYFDDLKSDYADMKNSANDSLGGTIRGAIFLKQFIRKGVPWAHLDIAATGNGMGHLPYYPKKGASGAYVRTLAQFAADY